MYYDEKTITREMLDNAKTYLSYAEKEEFVNKVTNECFDRLNISDGTDSYPPMYKENTAMKNRAMMTAFVTLYLGVDAELDAETGMMTVTDYDNWASSHPMNQLERFKTSDAMRNKVFDLIYDYKALEKRLNAEIYGRLQAMNDSVLRAVMKISESVTPQHMQELSEQLKLAQSELEKYQAHRGIAAEQDGEA